ncbi:hypothetical protein CGLO_13400 [Colletotrichum gloeosporioides Cg-14]|uniref:Uncharacterized protein n=1 Tax=Colletotrichum gloeosporioides (strain Cg-14) TaxID=1237896 RepID=T0JWR2_COLGC|nr:hypothetical protein CGLO_13400 [Colletotrichum gloeosporioides Cg-14]
MKSTAWTNSV